MRRGHQARPALRQTCPKCSRALMSSLRGCEEGAGGQIDASDDPTEQTAMMTCHFAGFVASQISCAPRAQSVMRSMTEER